MTSSTQLSWELDGIPMRGTLTLPEGAEVAAAPGNGYNGDGTRLDPEALDLIIGWLRRVLG
jgi:hypothetical protein